MTLSPDARAKKSRILSRVLAEVEGDPERFGLVRGLWKELMYAERGKPHLRRKLKKQKHAEQNGICALCGKELALFGSERDRSVELSATRRRTPGSFITIATEPTNTRRVTRNSPRAFNL